MELRRAADVLLRTASPRTPPFQLPSARRHLPLFSSRPSLSMPSARPITNSTSTPQQAAAAKEQEQEQEQEQPADKGSPPAPSPRTPSTQNIAELDALLDGRIGASFPNRNAVPPRPPPRRPNANANDSAFARPSFVAGMNMPSHSAGGGMTMAMLDLPTGPVEQDTSAAPFRLGATLGRSMAVSRTEDGRGSEGARGADLARALRALEVRLAANRVRADMNAQRFHERPGLRRKRLQRERWRRRFKLDFQATARRVQELARKGW